MSKCNSCLRTLQNFMRNFDLFPATQFLRYRGDPEYSTATGGFTSIGIIAIFIVLFASMGLQTAKKNIITSSVSVETETIPSFVEFETSVGGNFMFGIGVSSVDLNGGIKEFDIQAHYSFLQEGTTLLNTTVIALEQCTTQHWNFDAETVEVFNTLNGTQWLCPPIGTKLNLGGKAVSDLFSILTITINFCNQTIDPSCISLADLTTLQTQLGGQFRLVVPVVSTVINAGDKQYWSTSFQDRNSFTFATWRGLQAKGYIESVAVETDQSLLPFTDIKTQEFTSIPDYFQTNTIASDTGKFAQITMQKSPQAITHSRAFNKVDEYFSYVGGLIGTILGLIFIMGFYSQRAYGISIASELFLDGEGKTISSNSFHIGYMVTLALDWVSQKIGCCRPTIGNTQFYSKCLDQIDEQLNIAHLIKKIIYLQRAIGVLLSDEQLEALQLHKKDTIQEAQINRKRYETATKLGTKAQKEQEFSANGAEGGLGMVTIERGSEANIKIEGLSEVNENQNEVESRQRSADSVSCVSSSKKQALRRKVQTVIKNSERGDEVSSKIVRGISESVLVRVGAKLKPSNKSQGGSLLRSKRKDESQSEHEESGSGIVNFEGKEIEGFE